jgi:hypothetical protein
MREADIQDAIHALSRGDLRLFRNNVGTARTGDGRFIRFGLHPGSPDLIGWRRCVITPDMVGQTLAVAVGIEVKTTKGRVTSEQAAFLGHMQDFGALAGVARSADEALRLIYPAR